jgi:pimeloyl-ACP methyl ester carboxylesterase
MPRPHERAEVELGRPGETHFARTADGWDLALRRYAGGDSHLPVILCPGYGCSALFLDYDERHSLARYLARSGFDAWTLDLRGRGASRPVDGGRGRWRWTFDDFVRYDLPSAIDAVRRATGRRRIAWVGHSMGGSAMYAFLGTSPLGREAVAALVTIASPVVYPAVPRELIRRFGRALVGLPFPLPAVPQRVVVGALWNALGFTRFIRIGMNPLNVDRRLARSVLRAALHDVPWAKLRQLAMWSSEQVFCSEDRSVDYRAELGRIETPLLAAAGADDRLAPPSSVRLGVDEVSSRDRTFIEFGERSGFSTDYGHIDLIFGRDAPDEVFPKVRDWLSRRTRR